MSSPDNLSPPPRTKTENPGAHELESDSEEHFSDAQSNVVSPTPTSPVPRTRVEKISDEPSYGEVPGTDAYNKRTGDAPPDEIAVVPDHDQLEPKSGPSEEDNKSGRESPLPGGQPIPVTVVEQAVGDSGPHSEAFEAKHKADASPDVVVAPEGASEDDSEGGQCIQRVDGQGLDQDIHKPEQDAHESEVQKPEAQDVLESEAQDLEDHKLEDQGLEQVQEEAQDGAPEPVSQQSSPPASSQFLAPLYSPPGGFPMTPSDFGDEFQAVPPTDTREDDDGERTIVKADSIHGDDDTISNINATGNDSNSQDLADFSNNLNQDLDDDDDDFGDDFAEPSSSSNDFDNDFGDDFDDFEDGADADFGDFGDAFKQPDLAPPVQQPVREPSPRPTAQLPLAVPDFDGLESDEMLSLMDPYLALLFPPEQLAAATSELPPSKGDSIFLTPRSVSLWSQLVEPPPLAPPDWIRSRIRRAFLVSLGVPVDLDEILPASKQKKLVLPSLRPTGGSGTSTPTARGTSPYPRLRPGGANASSTSVDSHGNPKRTGTPSKLPVSSNPPPSRRGPAPEPDFDLVAARQLCTTTTEALDGMTDIELQAHVERLEAMQARSRDVLEYWQKRADEKIGDREAFEGVIENLVKHARKVRK